MLTFSISHCLVVTFDVCVCSAKCPGSLISAPLGAARKRTRAARDFYSTVSKLSMGFTTTANASVRHCSGVDLRE